MLADKLREIHLLEQIHLDFSALAALVFFPQAFWKKSEYIV